MPSDPTGWEAEFVLAGPGQVADVLMVLDEAAAWLRSREIGQWPPRFEPSWVEAAVGRGETWLVTVDGTVSATVTLDLADPVWDGTAGTALYVHRTERGRPRPSPLAGTRITYVTLTSSYQLAPVRPREPKRATLRGKFHYFP